MKRLYFISILSLLVSSLLGQNATVSPYSRYAFGELDDNVPSVFRAMGGVRYGMRDHLVICPAQPASYTTCDSLTFMMDFAAHLTTNIYQDAAGKQNKWAGNLDYITIQLPFWKRYIAGSIGIMPYSAVGYDFSLSDSIPPAYHYSVTYSGSGGITDLYVGLGGNIKNWVAIGFNLYYMFGEVSNSRYLFFEERGLTAVQRDTKIHANSLRFRYGLQVFHTFAKHDFALGLIYEHKQKMKGEYSETSSSDTVEYAKNSGLSVPSILGVGFSYRWNNRLCLAVDYEMQQWKAVDFLADYAFGRETLKNTHKIGFGVEYRHSPLGKNYAERMMWRAGFNMSSSYVDGIKQPNMTASMGFGFPFRSIGSIFNFSVEYIRRGSKSSLLENEIRATVNATIRENWFFKRKL